MKHLSLYLKAATAITAGLLLFSCKQEPKVIELSVSDKTIAFETAGGDKTVTVTCNDAWTVSCTADWLTVSPKSGEGNGSLKVTALENTSFDVRGADITVTAGDKSQTVRVNQLAPSPSLVIAPESAEAAFAGGDIDLKVTANAPWTLTVQEGCDWLLADKTEGTGSADVKVTVLQNLEREARSAKVTVKETVGGTSRELTVNQEAAPLSRRSDSLTLVAIYNAADGATWAKNQWDLATPIDTWAGVTLNGEGRVSVLKLTTSGVITKDWTLPADIGDLTELTDLRISSNKLTGEIPDAVYSLSKLEKLYFQNDDLTGSLSPKLAQLTELTELYVDRNANLSGSIPAEIGNLKKLARINVSQSGIGGGIPAELGQCESLLQFMAFKTQLTGTLPDIWDMPVLQTVMLHTNPGLTGELPNSLSKLKPIVNGSTVTAPSLQLYGCNFTGTIPESFAELHEKTKQVFVQENRMSGVISLTVQAHPNFASWKYSPQQEGYGLTLEKVDYRQLDSLALIKVYSIADGANWKESRRWKLEEPIDTWPGIKLNEEGRVVELNITNGTVTTVEWEIPEAITDLTELSTLQIVGSKLKGEIPAFLYGMTKLVKIRFNSNDLTGSLSDKIGQWTNLTELYLNGNKQFGGTIPATIGALKKLESINIAQTAIGGEIPQALAECTALKNFMAWSNKLSGEIPDFWDQLPEIGVLQLYGNPDITGPIPASIGSLKKATGIQLKDCNLTGNIPASFGGLEKCGNLQLSGNKLSGVVPAEVQAHPKWLPDAGWKYATNILPQQEGFGLTLE